MTNTKDNEKQKNESKTEIEREVLSETEQLIRELESNPKAAKLIKEFDKHVKNFNLKKLIDNEKKMLEKVDQANKEKDEYLDLLQRFKADFENYKKRAQKLSNNSVQLSSERIVTKVIDPIEDLSRIVDFASEKESDIVPLEGIDIVYNKLLRILEDEQVAIIEPKVGSEFDPRVHEAIVVDNSGKYKPGMVVQLLEKGYTIKGKIIHAAKVVVSAEAIQEETKTKEENKEE
ncbi:MAG: nucleotide exchange factor GrpE [Candidatus Heimdallarchaeota archaeon]